MSSQQSFFVLMLFFSVISTELTWIRKLSTSKRQYDTRSLKLSWCSSYLVCFLPNIYSGTSTFISRLCMKTINFFNLVVNSIMYCKWQWHAYIEFTWTRVIRLIVVTNTIRYRQFWANVLLTLLLFLVSELFIS